MGGRRRKIHHDEAGNRVLVVGRPELHPPFTDNSVYTAKYTLLTFFPSAIREQFRRNGNIYFLFIGCLMAIGWYTPAFDTSISPWTTLGPLALVVSISLAQEAYADLARHRSDVKTNVHPCVVLRRAEELDHPGRTRDPHTLHGRDVKVNLDRGYDNPSTRRDGSSGAPTVAAPAAAPQPRTAKIAFESVRRMDIRTGNLVLIRNRDMIPADLVLLASSSERGNVYIETSSIDGETNLKLRTSPHLPNHGIEDDSSRNLSDEAPLIETLEQATKRIARFSLLGFPEGENALENPANPDVPGEEGELRASATGLKRKSHNRTNTFESISNLFKSEGHGLSGDDNHGRKRRGGCDGKFVAALTSEPPNAHVNTFSGKLTLPPIDEGSPSLHIPLNAENMLLRGAVLRNTEWAIGLACFTGSDTKLVQNSFDTPSKFSRLDHLINRTVILILCVMVVCVLTLAGLSISTYDEKFDTLWYAGYNENSNMKWPYLEDLDEPDWDEEPPRYGQMVSLFITLLSNFVPLSLYVTIEIITLVLMFFIGYDKNMYHEETDTPAVARSTIVSDLGQVEYIFSDKTGTLTCNIMRFKRCSVDGMMFGAPVEKSAPVEIQAQQKEAQAHTIESTKNTVEDEEGGMPPQSFHPLRQLLVGTVPVPSSNDKTGLEGYGEPSALLGSRGAGDGSSSPERLTFNAEMFLRVMSVCHTVVVEKDYDAVDDGGPDTSDRSQSSSFSSSLGKFFRKRKNTGDSSAITSSFHASGPVQEGFPSDEKKMESRSEGTAGQLAKADKGSDGAPLGYAYQAESPDEGALVTAASLEYGFQLIGRDSSGVQLACSSPSLFEDEQVTDRLKKGTVTAKALAAESASPAMARGTPSTDEGTKSGTQGVDSEKADSPRVETWEILAVNKFDSDRKRMSVLVRSPPELGSVPMLLCKGADSSMLDSKVCEGGDMLMLDGGDQNGLEEPSLSRVSEENDEVFDGEGHSGVNVPNGAQRTDKDEENNWEMAAVLGIQSHLGEFASEGLRTLVLGVRILTEEQTEEWLTRFKAAATSIKDRDQKLTEVAYEIEQGLHIVGATAIEDKLQDGVPETIASLGEAGIKLWVLTGDKRETAIEIGYSTKVLTPKMHLTEVSDGPDVHIKTLMAMEFIRLVKLGKLLEYQKSSLETHAAFSLKSLRNYRRPIGRLRRKISRAFRRFYHVYMKSMWQCCTGRSKDVDEKVAAIDKEEEDEEMKDPRQRHRKVRNLADSAIQDYLNSPDGMLAHSRRAGPSQEGAMINEHEDSEDISLASDEVPAVFERATSARAALDRHRKEGSLSSVELRNLTLATLTSQQMPSEAPLVDEDTLSLDSFFPGDKGGNNSSFDKKKRSLMERLFATDRDVRHGRLTKHLKDEELKRVVAAKSVPQEQHGSGACKGHEEKHHGPRALVIEGAALKHLLGDSLWEEMLFAVASCCDSVIACRVSPKQKALLVKMVRNYVEPEPVTLAIGDGANDVGMIQEAHVGVGISGLEGQQAVNASDFAIAQFRFLKELLLIHGRWNFMRMSKVVLFSFYKNAVMAGTLIVFQSPCLYSGTPMYDMWVISMLNFVAGIPILFTGLFDRDLPKEYVHRNPEVYASGPNNEHLTMRMVVRWVCITLVHIYTIYYLSAPALAGGGGVTSAFDGLMGNVDRDYPGDGEGGDLMTFGTTIYTTLIFTLAYKALYETRSLIHGEFPACTCKNDVGEGYASRIAYTWVGVSFGSIGFYIWALYMYQFIGRLGASSFSAFVYSVQHAFNMRSITWMVVLLTPTAACVFDVTGKVYANMFFPTQTQIHMEIAATEEMENKSKKTEQGQGSAAPMVDV